MGIHADRAAVVRELAEEYTITTEFVMDELGCGRGQALRAIRQARADGAEDGERWSYAVGGNQYEVERNGAAPDRVRSYTTRLQSIVSQRKNAGKVMAASVDYGRASKLERAVAQMGMADQVQAEADEIRLRALKELLD